MRRQDFPPLASDEFYWLDLIGLMVENPQGQSLGRVVGLMENAAHPILRVAPQAAAEADRPERLIPFVRAVVLSVEREANRIVVDWGLDY